MLLLGVASVVYMVQTLLLGELICWLGLFKPGLNVVLFMSLLPGEDCFH